ncbi:MAG: T9SS type A sorting domain-containing protein [Bacteroidota bacterium]
MKNKLLLFFALNLILVVDLRAQRTIPREQKHDLPAGLNSDYWTVEVDDSDPKAGFLFRVIFRYGWATKNTKDLIWIKHPGSDADLMKFTIVKGALQIQTSVKVGGSTKDYAWTSWQPKLLNDQLKGQLVTMEVGISEGSIKVFIFRDDDYKSYARCETSFTGIGAKYSSKLSERIGSLNKLRFKFYAHKPDNDVKSGVFHLNFQADHKKNEKSCYTLNSNWDNNDVANALSGLTKYNKKNCAGPGGSQKRVSSDENEVDNDDALTAEIERLDALDNVIIYPIPARDILTLDFPEMWWNSEVELSLVTLAGKVLFNGYRFSPSGGREEVDVSLIEPGTYFLITENNERRDVKRVIIE